MDDTWSWRDLTVPDAVVRQMDEINKTGSFPDGVDIARSTRLGILDVAAALDALEGEFLSFQRTSGGPEGWFVTGVTSAARREVGQWPTGQSFIERLAAGIAEAAEREADPERKQRLRVVARELGGAAKSIAINVASEILEHRLPHRGGTARRARPGRSRDVQVRGGTIPRMPDDLPVDVLTEVGRSDQARGLRRGRVLAH